MLRWIEGDCTCHANRTVQEVRDPIAPHITNMTSMLWRWNLMRSFPKRDICSAAQLFSSEPELTRTLCTPRTPSRTPCCFSLAP